MLINFLNQKSIDILRLDVELQLFAKRHGTTIQNTELNGQAAALSVAFSSTVIDFYTKQIIFFKQSNAIILASINEDAISISKFFFYCSLDKLLEETNFVLTDFTAKEINMPAHQISAFFSLASKTIHHKIHPELLGQLGLDLYANGLFQIRHDIIVNLIFKLLGKWFTQEKPLSDFFKKSSDTHYLKKTPDIVLEITPNQYDVFEVTVTTAPSLAKSKKTAKYKKILDDISLANNVHINYKIVSIFTTMKNLYAELMQYFPTTELSSPCSEVIQLIDSLQITLKNYQYMSNIKKPDIEEAGRLKIINDLKIDFSPYEQIEKDLINASNQEFDYQTMFAKILRGTHGKEVETHVPVHCDINSLINLKDDIRQNITTNFKPLDMPAPSLHFPLDPKIMKYSETTPVSEENIALSFAEECGVFVEDPAFPESAFAKKYLIH
jgi:hypothetical protein